MRFSALIFPALVFAVLTPAACSPARDSGPIDVAIIGAEDELLAEPLQLSPAAQHLHAATYEGLVALDPAGQVVPAIAERWIVTDDGLSYIFRLRDSNWPDGEPITARDVRNLLREVRGDLVGTPLGLDLAKLTDIRAMAGRVVELRLSSPMPEFLRLLAQPELGLVKSGGGGGPMVMSRDEQTGMVRLSALPPDLRGMPAREDWEDLAQALTVTPMPAESAVEAFSRGDLDLVLNGTIATFPLAELGPLSRGTIQVDPALGLFGLHVLNDTGLLASADRREALSMALDRDALIQPFGLGGWQPYETVLPPGPVRPPDFDAFRWPDLDLAQRREVAAARIEEWTGETDEPAVVLIDLPEGPGSDILLREIARAWQSIGVETRPAQEGEAADLELRDRLARYSSPRWFLNQFNCDLDLGLCSQEADELVRQSLTIRDPATKQDILLAAHSALVESEAFIPLGPPVRWSLVRGAIGAYQPNQWGLHPLFPLSQPPD